MVQEWLAQTAKMLPDCDMLEIRERLACKDGFDLSVQASRTHYCTPRDNVGPWTHVEVGYPSAVCQTLLPYAEDRKHPTDTIYGQVPVEVIDRIIRRHGGIV